jgi:hypothetical protein
VILSVKQCENHEKKKRSDEALTGPEDLMYNMFNVGMQTGDVLCLMKRNMT